MLYNHEYKKPPNSVLNKVCSLLGISKGEFNDVLDVCTGKDNRNYPISSFERSFLELNLRNIKANSALETSIKYFLSKKEDIDKEEEYDDIEGQLETMEQLDDAEEEEYNEMDPTDVHIYITNVYRGSIQAEPELTDTTIMVDYMLNNLKNFDYNVKRIYTENLNGKVSKQRNARDITECMIPYSLDPRPIEQKILDLVSLNYKVTRNYSVIEHIPNVVLFIDISGSMQSHANKLAVILKFFIKKSEQGKMNLLIVCFEAAILSIFKKNIEWKTFLKHFPDLAYGGTNIQNCIREFMLKEGDYSEEYNIFFEKTTEFIIINDGNDRCTQDLPRKAHCLSLAQVNETLQERCIKSGGIYKTI